MKATRGRDAGEIETEINAREAEIIGKPQRFVSLSLEDLDDDAKAFLVELAAKYPMPADAKPRPLPTTYQVMLRHPELCRQQSKATGFYAHAELPFRDRELAILRVAWHCGAPFVFGEHIDLAKNHAGMTAEELDRITQGADAPGWSAHERAIIKGVEELISNHIVSDETWAELAKTWTERQLMEFPAIVGQYFCSCLVQNSMRTRLSETNIGLRQHRR
jgi:alkylhydroperoxidase family enzyme